MFPLFLKSKKRSGSVFAKTCYQKDINPVMPDKNKMGKDHLTKGQDIHWHFDTTDCTAKTGFSRRS